MPEPLIAITAGLSIIGAGLLVAIFVVMVRRGSTQASSPLQGQFDVLEASLERTARTISDELSKSRAEETTRSRELREEVGQSLKAVGDSITKTIGEISAAQRTQLEAVPKELAALAEASQANSKLLREEVATSLKGTGDSLLKSVGEITAAQARQLDGFGKQLAAMTEAGLSSSKQLREEVATSLRTISDAVVKSMTDLGAAQHSQLKELTESNASKLEQLRAVVDDRLKLVQEENAKKLEEIRQTVDERLQGTLEKRLGESFQLVSERLEQVHRGLGEMQALAIGVGDLRRVLTNVATRGAWGEVRLGSLLQQILTPEQYSTNVITKAGSGERVEFALRLPGNGQGDGEVWLPIDAKFPLQDYERLALAAQAGDIEGVEAAAKQLEMRIRSAAKDIRDKYLNPPFTTDFGVLFLPTEGLYAEVLRRPGLVELLQRDYRVNVTGPTTLAALLNSLQMGFRTLAIQRRSSEVWNLLGVVKTEFERFGEVLSKVEKKLQEASTTIEAAKTRTRVIGSKLRDVQKLPASDAEALLVGVEGDDASEGNEEFHDVNLGTLLGQPEDEATLRTCVNCGEDFLHPRQRGRPPVRCEKCRGETDWATEREAP